SAGRGIAHDGRPGSVCVLERPGRITAARRRIDAYGRVFRAQSAHTGSGYVPADAELVLAWWQPERRRRVRDRPAYARPVDAVDQQADGPDAGARGVRPRGVMRDRGRTPTDRQETGGRRPPCPARPPAHVTHRSG